MKAESKSMAHQFGYYLGHGDLFGKLKVIIAVFVADFVFGFLEKKRLYFSNLKWQSMSGFTKMSVLNWNYFFSYYFIKNFIQDFIFHYDKKSEYLGLVGQQKILVDQKLWSTKNFFFGMNI